MILKIDDEFKNLIPPLTAEEFSQLEQNIIKDGCREPLVVWGGYIVDGHNRYDICSRNDIEFQTLDKQFNDRQEVIEWIILNQFGRRNLQPFQRSELALRLKPIIQAKAKENQKEFYGNQHTDAIPQKSAKVQTSIETRNELAKLAGVSHDTIEKTQKILKEGTEEQIERARVGGKGNSVNSVFNEIKNATQSETKKCCTCKQEKPITDFYKGHYECKKCHQKYAHPSRNFKGDVFQISDELKGITEEEVIGDLYDTNKVIDFTVNDFNEELKSFIDYFKRNVGKCLEEHKELLNNKENIETIMENLTDAEKSITEWKGAYSI